MPVAPTTIEIAPTAVHQSRAQRLVEITLIVLVFLTLAGDPPPNVNEAHYLCRLKHDWNPQWCAGDLFLESKDAQVLFVWAFGWVTRFLSLTATAWVGRAVAWALFAWAWQRLSWRALPRPYASVLTAALFFTLNEHLNLAGEWVVGGVEGKCFAYVFVLVALRDMIDRRWNRVWLLVGAATALHPIVGGWTGVVGAAIWFYNDRRDVSFRKMLPGLIGGAIISLPGIVPALLLTWDEPPELVNEANQIYVFDRLPHHLAPLTLPVEEAARRVLGHLAMIGLLGAIVVGLRRVAWGATGSASASPSVNDTSASRPLTADRSLHFLLQYALGALMIAGIGFAIELALWSNHELAAKILRYYWFRLTDFALPTATAICGTALIAIGLEQRRAWAPWVLSVALLATGWNVAHATFNRYLDRLPPADQKLRDLDLWSDACKWAADNTPADAVFLTPRLNLTFKWRAGRAEVANRKDLPQDARSIVEWNRRIQDIYYATIEGQLQPLDSLGVLGTDRVRELAKKYGATYVLVDRGQLLTLPIVHSNKEYIIYRVDPDK